MFPRPLYEKQQKTSKKLLGRVAFVNDHKVVLKISEGVIPYREGQRIIVSVENERKAASGKIIKVGEIIAYGKIADISQNAVTIRSRMKNPIISQSALRDNQAEEQIILVEAIEQSVRRFQKGK